MPSHTTRTKKLRINPKRLLHETQPVAKRAQIGPLGRSRSKFRANRIESALPAGAVGLGVSKLGKPSFQIFKFLAAAGRRALRKTGKPTVSRKLMEKATAKALRQEKLVQIQTKKKFVPKPPRGTDFNRKKFIGFEEKEPTSQLQKFINSMGDLKDVKKAASSKLRMTLNTATRSTTARGRRGAIDRLKKSPLIIGPQSKSPLEGALLANTPKTRKVVARLIKGKRKASRNPKSKTPGFIQSRLDKSFGSIRRSR